MDDEFDKFRRIKIENSSNAEGQMYGYYPSENTEQFTDYPSTDEELFGYYPNEPTPDYDFIIKVPVVVEFNELKMRSVVERMKFMNVEYIIQITDE